MESKPYTLQSPEQIAKDYGGNKQKIAEAMQLGIVDPTAGTMAGMFIDRMRAAAQAEQAPQQTVAQQVFAPPAPPAGGIGMPPPPMPMQGPSAGLGATPEAAQMQAPMPEMPAPEMPAAEMPAAEMPAAEEAPMGMKGGGKVHGHFNASDKGSNYGANISLDDLTSFSLEGLGRRVFDPDVIRAALRHRKGDTEFNAEHTLRGGSDYGIERPFLGGRLGIHAGASRGFIPDSVRASYSRSFADGGMVPPYASGGGLSQVPIPAGMFDEPNNGGYANGGIVAFASGGPLGPYYEETVLKALPGTRVTSRQRSAADNARVGGVPNSYHRTDNARDFVPPPGMDIATFAATLKRTLGKGTDVINEGDHVHTEPGSKNSRMVAPMPRETDTTTAAGRGASLEDQIAFANSMYAGLPREAMDRAKAAALEELDPEKLEKDRKYDMYSALTNFGLNIMSPDNYQGEGILGSIAKAAKTTLPEYEASKKERKAAKSAAVRELMALEDVDRKTAVAGVELGMEAYKVGMTAEQQQRALAFQEKQLSTTVSENALDREVQMAAAMYRARNPSDFDTKFAMYQKSYPGFSEVAILKQMKTDGLLGSSQAGMALPGMEGEMGSAGDANSGMSIVSSRPVQ